jgi:hypothetical protein
VALGAARRKEAEMAIYKLTSSIVVNIADGTVLVAGQTVTDTGPGAQLPPGYIPNGCCDAQDADGAQKMWNAGPITPTIDPFVPPPACYWRRVSGSNNVFFLNRNWSRVGPEAWGQLKNDELSDLETLKGTKPPCRTGRQGRAEMGFCSF